jgi:hypothetical protein
MIPRLRSLRKDDRGATLAMTAVMLFSILAFIALSFDLGILFVAHAEAQRAADGGALAGASAYQDFVPAINAIPQVNARAIQTATDNFIRNTHVDTPSVTVETDHNLRQVWVEVRRQNVPMWFARFVGITSRPVRASATAHATNAGGVSCLKPLAIPDHWAEGIGGEDNNPANTLWDPDEAWKWDPQADSYNGFGANNGQPETGFGSDYRNAAGSVKYDVGRMLIIKGQNPNVAPSSGFFYPLDLDGPGANGYENFFYNCAPKLYYPGDSIQTENGDMVGPTRFAVDSVMALDPLAEWDQGSESIINSNQGSNWKASKRAILLAIFDPTQIPNVKGKSWLHIRDFAYFFVEGYWENGALCTVNCGAQAPVVGKFLYYANGVGAGGTSGQLVLQIQLIK